MLFWMASEAILQFEKFQKDPSICLFRTAQSAFFRHHLPVVLKKIINNRHSDLFLFKKKAKKCDLLLKIYLR